MRPLLPCLLLLPSAALAQEVRHDPIFNGTRAPRLAALSDGELLALGWLHPTDRPAGAFCTGSVISPTAVITARHCFGGTTPAQVAFSVGQGPATPLATVAVVGIARHPLLDVALLRLERSIVDAAPAVVPLRLAAEDPSPLVEALVDAGGHGRTEEGEGRGRFFATLSLRCVDDHYVQVDGRGAAGLCDGDSGGPIFGPDGAVIAIEHEGDRSCVDVDYGLRVDVIRPWIEDQRGRFAGALPRDACDGLTYRGRCAGADAEWCDAGAVQAAECGAQACGFTGADSGFYCRDPLPCSEGAGTCEGGVARRCNGGLLQDEDCVAAGKVCVVASAGPRCIARCGAPAGLPIDDGLGGGLRRPGDGVLLKGHVDLSCRQAPIHAPGWALLLLLGLSRKIRCARPSIGRAAGGGR